MEKITSLSARDRIMVALDCDQGRALDLADCLTGHVRWLKIGMTLFYALGPSIVYDLKARGFNIFLDLKFHDIPHQVYGAAASATKAGADMLTMHAIGGIDMMKSAREGATKAAEDFGLEVPVLLAITVLTSMNQDTLSQINVKRAVTDQVQDMALLAKEAKLDGVVASPQESAILREILHDDAYIVTPGIRPQGSDAQDQSRIATPSQALLNGSSHLVIGRPITQATDPVVAVEEIVASIESSK